MNKVILMGRLTRSPEVIYTNSQEPIVVAKFALAVNRRFKRNNEPEADFFNCTTFGKTGEFVEKYFTKGQLVSVVGRLENRSWDGKDGTKKHATDVIVEEAYFAEAKKTKVDNSSDNNIGFNPIDESIDDEDLPF